jgi:2-polyprenyl-6-methoxyphenol hydroxylase-like FAD-dependent oxidoreductase
VPDRALIIGAGVAGLTTGIALKQAGFDVTVTEQSDELREIGAGLGVQYAAMKALRRIGMEEATRELGARLEAMEWTTWDGKPLVTIPHGGIRDKVGSQTVNVHRGEFLSLLVDEFGRDRIQLGRRFEAFEENGDGVTVRYEDGSTERAALVVGADGSRSRVRAQSLGDPSLRDTNVVVWRAMPPFEHEKAPLGILRQAYGRGKLFSFVPGTKGRVFWFAVGLVSEFGERPPADVKREVVGAFGDWDAPIPEMIESTGDREISRTLIFDRHPEKRWGTDRVTLVGDAAHPIMPTLGQGASTGIEDGVVLAKHLAETDGLGAGSAVQGALRAYEAERIARTTPLVNNAHKYAWIALANNPVSQRARDLFLRMSPGSTWEKRLLAQHSYEP